MFVHLGTLTVVPLKLVLLGAGALPPLPLIIFAVTQLHITPPPSVKFLFWLSPHLV